MFQRILLAAVVAGLAAGLVLSAATALKVTPLILEAEVYETGGDGAHQHEADAWAPGEGLERTVYTVLTSVLAGVGFALLLCAAWTLRGRTGGWREGLLWGLGGYAAFSLAPSLGLPPELPGMTAADLADRQIWWATTAATTAAGLAVLVFAPRRLLMATGCILVVLPHLVGAPHPPAGDSAVPAELAAAFVSASLVANLLFWLTLGMVGSEVFARMALHGRAVADQPV